MKCKYAVAVFCVLSVSINSCFFSHGFLLTWTFNLTSAMTTENQLAHNIPV